MSAASSNFLYQDDIVTNKSEQLNIYIGTTVTRYLLDLQPGLAVVLSETAGAATTRYVHGPRGIHAQKDSANNWEWMAQDGLDSVTHLTHAARWKPCPIPSPERRRRLGEGNKTTR